tara:strand:+ start:806 stop:1369 length:564 start_codon:yes stop_codon:yes gene_type:complete
MPKLISLVFTVFLTINLAIAQDYTPKAGNWSLGTSAEPILNYIGNLVQGTIEAPELNFANGMHFSAKFFTEDRTAWRAGAHLYFTSDSNSTNPYSFGFTAGKEFRKGRAKLQGFYGYQGNLFLSNTKDSTGEKYTDVAGGINGFIGVEYFIKEKIALGAEYLYGLNIKNDSFVLGGTMGTLMLNFYF